MKIRIRHADGRVMAVDNEDEARSYLATDYAAAVYGDWEPCGEDMERQLVWPTSRSAYNDDGLRAVAELQRTTPGH